MNEVIFIKGELIHNHARVKNFISYFQKKNIKFSGWCWNRNKSDKIDENFEKVIFAGGGFGNKILLFYYPIWMIKILYTLIIHSKSLKDSLVMAIDLDAALPVFLYKKCFQRRLNYIYDIHDDFDLRYNLPNFLKTILIYLDRKVKENAFMNIHVDFNRIRDWEKNYKIIYNSPPDFYSNNFVRNSKRLEKKFAFSGVISKNRGASSVYSFLKEYPNIELIVAGKIIDEEGKRLIELPNVDYLGYVSQDTLFDKIKACSGIFSLYNPNLEINKLAASNKLYDALMLGIPIITNEEISAAGFVQRHKTGLTVPFEYNRHWSKIIDSPENELIHMGSRGRKLYEDRYTYEKNYTKNLDTILTIL